MKKFLELLFLKQIKGIGNVAINRKYSKMIEEVEDIEQCLDGLLGSYDIRILENAKEEAIKKYDKIINDHEIRIITIFDPEYPSKFNDLGDKKPVILYAKGNTHILNDRAIAVVGTREPSLWSHKVAVKLVKKMIELSGRVIVSGLALGCDRIAHESTMATNGQTIAVLPSGVNVITPASHKELARTIIDKNGCLLSEYEPESKVRRSTYVERDTLIAALCDATFVIECDVNSGTMHTVNAAEKLNRSLACYFTDETDKGNFAGNKFMIDKKGAIRVSDKVDLERFLRQLDEYGGMNQMSFFD